MDSVYSSKQFHVSRQPYGYNLLTNQAILRTFMQIEISKIFKLRTIFSVSEISTNKLPLKSL